MVATVLRIALCESIRYQAKSEQNVWQDLIPRVRHGEAAVMHPNQSIMEKWQCYRYTDIQIGEYFHLFQNDHNSSPRTPIYHGSKYC